MGSQATYCPWGHAIVPFSNSYCSCSGYWSARGFWRIIICSCISLGACGMFNPQSFLTTMPFVITYTTVSDPLCIYNLNVLFGVYYCFFCHVVGAIIKHMSLGYNFNKFPSTESTFVILLYLLNHNFPSIIKPFPNEKEM